MGTIVTPFFRKQKHSSGGTQKSHISISREPQKHTFGRDKQMDIHTDRGTEGRTVRDVAQLNKWLFPPPLLLVIHGDTDKKG